jgi:hypothetical protein
MENASGAAFEKAHQAVEEARAEFERLRGLEADGGDESAQD